MNRRGNGLSADTYAPLVDLAPHLADAMLAALGEAGVAAYAASPSDLPDLSDPPGEPVGGDVLDRLYVDVDMKPTAEGILRAHLARLRDTSARGQDAERPETDLAAPRDAAETRDAAENQAPAKARDADLPAERDEDAIWAEIVAGFDSGPEGDDVPWPDEENIREPADPPREGDDRTGRLPRARVIKPAETPDVPPDDDADGHYIPPPPPPLPSADPLTKSAWVALIGGPVYLLATVILDWEVPGWAAFLAVAAFIGGFVTLVLRMGDEPRDPDDGAVV
ncbi:hypothetical protein [Spirillospora sp. NPDC048819]|uniref:hypothetical protein n=1 Tax=Spirillospora sp. NPDC048819 TaxID=3155268 RepID=UPI0033EDFF37